MHVEDIHIYWERNLDSQSYCNFSSGSIVIQKDRWLEGIIKDISFAKHNLKSDIRFIFGIYVNEEILELFYCREAMITRFYCNKEGGVYKGKISLIGPYQEKTNGNCEIRTLKSSLYDVAQINNRIRLVKSTLNSNIIKYYEDTYEKRNQIVAYEGYHNQKLDKMSEIGIHIQSPMYQQKKSKEYILRYQKDNKKRYNTYV